MIVGGAKGDEFFVVFVFVQFVDKNPIVFYVAVSKIFPFSLERVVFVFWFQDFSVY